ncbi:MAG: lactate racemase domain-containing protein [Desulfomonilia bacterium]
MNGHVEEIIYYGDDIRVEKFPDETRFFYANDPIEAAADPDQLITDALDHPLGAETLEHQLSPSSRVTIAFDDPCLPLPLMLNDPRGRVIEHVLKRLFTIGVRRENIRLICANGLHRKWTLRELSCVLGKTLVREMGPDCIACHDATLDDELISLGSTSSGHEVEINRAVVDSDITIYVNQNFTTMNGGWKSILVGLGSWRSIRHHHTPRQWNAEHSIMSPETSPMHAILNEMGVLVEKRCNVFQIETVTNNKIWPFGVEALLRPIGNRSRDHAPGIPLKALLEAASMSPQWMKRFVRNSLVRSDYRVCGVFSGAVDQVHEKTLDLLFRQQNVPVDDQVDILIFGVPNLSPYSAQSIFNPILLRSLVLGYLLGLFRNKPLVRKGGIIIACNPCIEKFHPGHHPSYVDFWEHDMESFYDPLQCWDELAEDYAENPRYLRLYRDNFAYHGTHSLINWMWSGMCLKHLSAAIIAGARQPATARKISFLPARDLSEAISMARNLLGGRPSIGCQVIPPLFCVDIA